MKDRNFILIIVGCVLAFFMVCLTVCAKMFEYSLFVLFGKDIPWYYDCLGGIVLNGINFPVWVFSLIAAQCTTTPLFP